MPVQVVSVVITVAVVVTLGYGLYSWWSERERRRAEEELRTIRRYTARNSNNHDHLKVKHGTQRDAQAEVDRMRRRGYEDSERLNVYYNDELGGWFVGRGWK